MIIALCGKKGSGKDTTGAHLVEKHGYKRFALADPLKDVCAILFSLSHEQLNGDKEAPTFWGKSTREILQFVGTEMFREKLQELLPNIGDNFWALHLYSRLAGELRDNPKAKIVITDVRFENEISTLRMLCDKVVVWQIDRVVESDDPAKSGELHVSENQDLTIDGVVVNDVDIENLHLAVDELVSGLEN